MDQKKQETEEEKVSPEDLEAYQTAFDYCDTNKDGTISLGELKKVLNELGQNPTDEDVEQMIDKVDDNRNGSLEFPEFVKLMEAKKRKEENDKKSNELDELACVFKTFDRDGNGYLDPKELSFALKCIGEECTEAEVQEILKRADKNDDGLIDFEEFTKLMTEDDSSGQLFQQQKSKPKQSSGANLTV